MSSKLKGDLAPQNNKTPYELRMEILHLAQHISERNAEQAMNLLHLQSENKESVKNAIEAYKLTTVAEDCEQVLKTAKKLNDFISKG